MAGVSPLTRRPHLRRETRMRGKRIKASVCALAFSGMPLLGGCVMQSTYNTMLQQQEAIEASLRSEIAADQVKIEQLENGIRVTMSDQLLYRSGAVELHPSGRAALDKVSGQLANMAAQGNRIDVVGNTDNVPIGPELAGRYPTNWELAGERASIVVRYLQERGVDPGHMQSVSNGQYHPVASNDTPAGRAKNRRTDLLLYPN
jgi:chemotaxis protein MotB